MCRACISHTYETHSYILKKDPPPQCEHCQCILVECNHLAQTRNDIFGRCAVVKHFQFHHELVLNFFTEILNFIQNFNLTKLMFYYCTALYTGFLK